jgi:hypothetical protein
LAHLGGEGPIPGHSRSDVEAAARRSDFSIIKQLEYRVISRRLELKTRFGSSPHLFALTLPLVFADMGPGCGRGSGPPVPIETPDAESTPDARDSRDVSDGRRSSEAWAPRDGFGVTRSGRAAQV